MRLHEAIARADVVARRGREPSTLTRKSEGEHGPQIRISFNPTTKSRVIESRTWRDFTAQYGPIGWTRWSAFVGFSADGVIADDWTLSW